MIHGLTEAEQLYLTEKLIRPLKEKNARVYIFGSRATNTQKKFSDIDILFIPNPKHPIPGHVLHQLLSEIEDSNFPYRIDLVNYLELAKSYKDRIEKEKIEIKD